jgi:hypothetical protein
MRGQPGELEDRARRELPGLRWVIAGLIAVLVGLVAIKVVTVATAVLAAVLGAVPVVVMAWAGRPESVRGSKNRPSPPLSAEKLLLFALPPRISDPIIGDLAERLPLIQERHGDRFARVWYWRQALGSVSRFLGLRMTGAVSLATLARFARRFLPL